LRFTEIYPPNEMKIDTALVVWNFLKFLKEKGYHIIHNDDLLAVPFSKMVKIADLK